jgi:hypothetical protein
MRTLAIAGVLLAVGTSRAQEKNLMSRVAEIKPRPEELKWQRIPWVQDLAEGQRLAKAENRPLFLWAIADAPLERV